MNRKGELASVIACAAIGVVACGKSSSTPSAPSAAIAVGGGANPDGSTLKVSQPALVSPVNGARLNQGDKIVLTVNNAKPLFVGAIPLSYRFELVGPSPSTGVVQSTLVGGGASTTSLEIDPSILEGEKTYTWRARAEYQGNPGPWATPTSFIAPQNTGYIRGNELYDPLIDGKTVGTIHGEVTFIPGVGVKLENPSSWIEYELPQQLVEGEYSLLATNLQTISATEDPKWRILSMREGQAPMNDNEYRMTIDKRGNGAIAWRFVSGDNGSGRYIETVGAERQTYPFHEDLTYFVRGSWFGGFFRVEFYEGGVGGKSIYDFGKGYNNLYQPFPHMVYIGSPWVPGQRGEASTVAGEIIRQVWVSARPRPAFANK